MGNRIREQKWKQLEKFRFNESIMNSFSPSKLLEEVYLKGFMKELTNKLGASSERVAASIFVKRYAFLAVMSLYAMSVWNKKLDVSIDNIQMEHAKDGENWLPSISFNAISFQDWDGKNRKAWRDQVMKDLFANHIFKLISCLEKSTGVSTLVLWENIAVYIFWLYETELKDIHNKYVSDDFHYLLLEAEGQLFGNYSQNPLLKYYGEKTYERELDDFIRVRKTCCFSYQLPAGKRCKICPCTHLAKDGRCLDGESICAAVRSFT